MLIQDIEKEPRTEVMDKSFLCELLHPKNILQKVAINYSLSHAIVPQGTSTLPHVLKTSSEVYYIISGFALMHIDGESEPIKAGQAVYIPPGACQHIENTGVTELEFLAIVDPMWEMDDEYLV